MNPIRQRACAVLDALHVHEEGDQTRESIAKARQFRASVASGRYPADALSWVWADPARNEKDPQPGELDRRVLVDGNTTAFGAMFGWLRSAEKSRGTMVLSGSTGSGKNVAAVYASVRKGGAFYLATKIGDLALGDNPVLRELAAVPFLVLDELGRENTIGPTHSRVIGLLLERHEESSTLITTNLTQAEFAARYGDHLDDRVKTSGGYVELRGTSRRKKGSRPSHKAIDHHCRVADLVAAVESLTTVGRPRVSESAIEELVALYQVTEDGIDAMIDRRREAMKIPDHLRGTLIESVLRVATGEATPAKEREHATEL